MNGGLYMIQITVHAAGCVIAVRAQPGARHNRIVGEHGGALKVAVTAPPDKGRANEAIAAVLADALGAKVELLSGATSRSKKFLVRDVTATTLQIKLRALLEV